MFNCANCGAQFEPRKLASGQVVFWQLYCKKECATQARNKRARERLKVLREKVDAIQK